MELYRDLLFKRNLYGYVEETRVQLYFTYIRQIPFWVVYHPHNDELDLLKVREYGKYFVAPESVLNYFKSFYSAWTRNETFIPSIDMTDEALDHLRTAKPDPNGLMYRVIYRNPFAEIEEVAFGSGWHDIDEPRFVPAKTYDFGRWCIYPEHIAKAVATLHSTAMYDNYVRDRVKNNPETGFFVVQSAPFHPSGNPPEGEDWVEVASLSHWNKHVVIDFNEDMSDIKAHFQYLN